MRFDAIGMFWDEPPQSLRGKDRIAPVMPPIPDTGWKPPTELPNLEGVKVLSIDTETWDPDLKEKGPGWARGVGHIVGVSISDGNRCWYFPLRHEIHPDDNWNPDVVLPWLNKILDTPHIPKVGANILYDIGWLQHEGVKVSGPLYDVLFGEALLSEAGRIDLELLGQKYLGEGKESNLLYEWCAAYYFGDANGKQRANIYRSPPCLVGPYAESDADLPLKILNKQWPLLAAEGLLDVFKMECELIYLTKDMRFAGVTVDIPKAEKLSVELMGMAEKGRKSLSDAVHFDVNVNANASLAQAFDYLGLEYPLTEAKNPSFTKPFLLSHPHPFAQKIVEVRNLMKLKGTFVDSYILDSHIDGRLFCQFKQLRGDDGGTRSGRFSSATPNLQNIPSRDPVLAPLIRGLFIPDAGDKAWRKYDYSQIEYRMLAHDAMGQSGEALRQVFIDDPSADYHEAVRQKVYNETGILLERKPIKNINFGLIYGMGINKLAVDLGLTYREALALFNNYHRGAPYVQETMDYYQNMALETGEIRTIMGRKSRFELWEPSRYDSKAIPLPYDRALKKWGRVKRAASHKALNRRLQGSAADIMKKAMHKCYYDGVFAETGIPKLTVHDELNFSDPGGKDEAFKEMKYIMETAVPLSIPVLVDGEIGPDWGHVKDL